MKQRTMNGLGKPPTVEEGTRQVCIVPFSPLYRDDFARLNLAWIEKLFVVELHDREQLLDPESFILKEGGHIQVALLGDEAVGTCALVRTGPSEYELAKMCVSEAHRGQGIGRLLCEAAVRKAIETGATRLWLESSRRLPAALALYERVGFVEVPLVPSPYERCDIRMEVSLPRETEQESK